MQPYIAVACALHQEGYDVKVATNLNHRPFVSECHLSCAAVFADMDKLLKDNTIVRNAMADGNTLKLFACLDKINAETADLEIGNWKSLIDDFKPDFIFVGSLTEYFGNIARYKLGIPTCELKLQYFSPKSTRSVMGLPDLPCGFNRWVLRSLFKQIHKSWRDSLDPVALKLFGYRLCDTLTRDLFLAEYEEPSATPVIVCQASCFADVLYPERPTGVRVVGQCVISADHQLRLARTSPQSSFGSEGDLAEVEGFLASGDKPVFMGWGSMTCKSPEYMVMLVIRALEHSRLRAVVQGGWANLSMEVLRRATSDSRLLQYAADNVLFVKAAPHEWLFPRCACTVHHGGAGTLSAAVRAGIPTVVTPVFLDQYDHANLVNRLGVGVGFKRQFQQITPKELGDAMLACLGSKEIAVSAKEVGAKLRAEDGIPAVVAFVEEFWSEKVESGRDRAAVDRRLRVKPASSFHLLGGLCSRLCS